MLKDTTTTENLALALESNELAIADKNHKAPNEFRLN